MKKLAIVTLGCPKNTVASNRLHAALEMVQYEIVADPRDAEACRSAASRGHV